MKLKLIVTLSTLTLSGCGNYFMPDRNVREQLAVDVVVGTWELTQGSLKLLARDGFRDDQPRRYELSFKPDGTCSYDSVLDLREIEYLSTPCAWVLEHDTRGNSNIKKKNALRLDFPVHGTTFRMYLNFAREDGRLLLWEYHRDPDSWEFIEYTHKPVAASNNWLKQTARGRSGAESLRRTRAAA